MKVAFTGAGYIINIHAQAARAQKDVELIAVVDKFPDKARSLAKAYQIKYQFETVEEMLKACHVDALVVGTPNYLHAPQTITALNAGVHVMVEKPMAMNSNEAHQMLQASHKSGALLMVAHCWRFDPEVIWLRNQVKQGYLGKIVRTKGYGVHERWGPTGGSPNARLPVEELWLIWVFTHWIRHVSSLAIRNRNRFMHESAQITHNMT